MRFSTFCKVVVKSDSPKYGLPEEWPQSPSKDSIYWDLPGHGTYGRCGWFKMKDGTDRFYSCRRLQCPNWKCVKSTCHRTAKRAFDVIQEQITDTDDVYYIIVSFHPDSDLSWMLSQKQHAVKMREVYKALISLGISGGVSFFCPYRWEGEFDGKRKRMPKNAIKSGLDFKLGPHMKIIGIGNLDFEKITTVYKETGLIVHILNGKTTAIRNDSNALIKFLHHMCLSAGCGMHVNTDIKMERSVRYFGKLACASKLRRKESEVSA